MGLRPNSVPAFRSQLPSVLPTYHGSAESTIVESPCATAAGKRINDETGATSGDVSEHSSTDAPHKDTSSESDEDSQPVIKIETIPIEDIAVLAGMAGPSPSKSGKSKL